MKTMRVVFGTAAGAVALLGLVSLDTKIPDIPNVTTPKPVAAPPASQVKPAASMTVSKESPFAQGLYWR